jgi:hypothetical protein
MIHTSFQRVNLLVSLVDCHYKKNYSYFPYMWHISRSSMSPLNNNHPDNEVTVFCTNFHEFVSKLHQ